MKEQSINIEQILQEAALARDLATHGIPVEQWGHGVAKSVGALLKEIQEGETVLQEQEDGTLCRLSRVAIIDVLYRDGEKLLKLKEEKQEMKNGSVRKRDLPTSLSEKFKFSDPDIVETIIRACAEEIQVPIAPEAVSVEEASVTRQYSPSYPGLLSEYFLQKASVELTPGQFRDTYQEVQKDKTTTFVWEEIA